MLATSSIVRARFLGHFLLSLRKAQDVVGLFDDRGGVFRYFAEYVAYLPKVVPSFFTFEAPSFAVDATFSTSGKMSFTILDTLSTAPVGVVGGRLPSWAHERNLFPCSPALLASIVALRARRSVCLDTWVIPSSIFGMSPIFPEAAPPPIRSFLCR